MNTTREQRAEAYTDKPDGVSTSEGHFYYLSEVEAAHIAGATEEAAIKDVVILEMAEALKFYENCEHWIKKPLEACDAITADTGARASKELKKHSALLEELAKGKV